MSTIWRKQDEEWQRLAPSGFPSEEKLHDLIAGSPSLLPLSGDPTVAVLGREVALGPGYADLVAVESDGRLVVIELKLRRNAEARRAVLAQVLTYAAYLKGLTQRDLEDLLRPHLARVDATSVVEVVRELDQSGEFDAEVFSEGLSESLAAGAFRLVLVLDEAPSELVQLVGYLESITRGVSIDLITVSAYEAGDEEILVPQRVEPEYEARHADSQPLPTRSAAKARREVDGSDAFEQAVERAPEADQAVLRGLLAWARDLEAQQLAKLRTVFGKGREILLVWVPGEKAGLVSIWNDGGAYISLWRSVFVRLAWERLAEVERIAGTPVGQGSSIRDPSPELLEALAAAYRDAATGQPAWNERDYYVSFGENDQRSWGDALEFGFVSAGGGEWYSKTLRQLSPGNRVFVYIPKGNGVGGYVGVGKVTGEAMLAKDFEVRRNGDVVSYVDAASSPNAGQYPEDPVLAEWVVPVEWLATRSREDAVKDSDFFANQNSAVKLKHGYTLDRLTREFGVER